VNNATTRRSSASPKGSTARCESNGESGKPQDTRKRAISDADRIARANDQCDSAKLISGREVNEKTKSLEKNFKNTTTSKRFKKTGVAENRTE